MNLIEKIIELFISTLEVIKITSKIEFTNGKTLGEFTVVVKVHKYFYKLLGVLSYFFVEKSQEGNYIIAEVTLYTQGSRTTDMLYFILNPEVWFREKIKIRLYELKDIAENKKLLEDLIEKNVEDIIEDIK